MRATIKGRWYRADNPQVVRLAIGRVGRVAGAISGSAVTFIVKGTLECIETALSDDEVAKDLLGYKLSVEAAKAIAGTIVAIGTAAAVAAGAVAAGIGTAPLWFVVGVGIVAGVAFDAVIDSDDFARRLQVKVNGALTSGGMMLDAFEREIRRAVLQQTAMFPR